MTSLTDLLHQPREQLLAQAEERGVAIRPHLQQDEVVAELITDYLKREERVTTDGVLTVLPDGFGFVRMLSYSFTATAIDAYVSPNQIRSLNLQTGHRICGPLRAPRGSERFFALSHIDLVQDTKPEDLRDVTVFEARTPIVATRALSWCAEDSKDQTLRSLQALAPIRYGHRVLLHAPSQWPRTSILTRTARSLRHQHPELNITICAIDQRPEDISSMRAALSDHRCDIVTAAFAAPPEQMVSITELALQHTKRHVEHGQDAVLLIDSLTALTRARSRSSAPSGAWIQPGLDAHAILKAKQLFAQARLCAEGGSLTILATIDQGEPGTINGAIEREFATCTNSDIVVTDLGDREDEHTLLFDPISTRTRPEDDPTPSADRGKLQRLRRDLAALPAQQRATDRLGI